MAVETTATDATFVGTGVSSTYSPGFYVNSSNQVKVYVNGVLKTIGDDYVVNNIGLSAGCNVVGTFPLASTVYIERVTPITQLVDTQNNETILEDVLDGEFDKLTMIAQELGGKVGRAILVPKGEAGSVLPSAANRAGKFLVFDLAGNASIGTGGAGDSGLRTDLADAEKLGAGRGAGLVGFTRRLLVTAYPVGSVGDRLSKVVFASDWDILPDGNDQRAKIQAMLNSGGSHFIFPAVQAGSTYICNGTVTVPGGITIEGQNMSSCFIQSNVLNAPIFSIVSTQRVVIRNMRLGYIGTPVLGASALSVSESFFCDFRDLWIENCYVGIDLGSAAAANGSGNHSIIGVRIFRYVRAGFLLTNMLDVNVSHFRLTPFDSIGGQDAGISLVGGCEAVTFSQGDITLGAGHAIATAGIAGSTARGQSPWYNKFVDVYCDSPKGAACYLRQAQHTTFIDCWFASAGHDEAVGFGSALDFSGVDMSQCKHIKFIGGEFYGNGGRGALVYSDNIFVAFIGVTVKRNQYTRPPGSACGIEFIAATTDFIVHACIFERDPDTTTWRMNVSVIVNVGASDRYIVADNLNGGTFVADSGTGVNKRVANNY